MAETTARPAGQRGQRLTYLVKRLEMAERARMEEVLRPLEGTLHQYTARSVPARRGGVGAGGVRRSAGTGRWAPRSAGGGCRRRSWPDGTS